MTQVIALAFLAIWLVAAVLLGIVMHRRGYNGFGWGVIGAALGPIGVLLAFVSEHPAPPDRWEQAGLAASGPVDLLIGTDGSAGSIAAATSAIALLGERVGRVTLAAVTPFDATRESEEQAQRALDATRAAITDQLERLTAVAGEVVLHGRPADALRDRARDGGYDAIVVGSHGRGASAKVLGSVTSALVERGGVPLIVTGRGLVDRHAPAAASSHEQGAATEVRR